MPNINKSDHSISGHLKPLQMAKLFRCDLKTSQSVLDQIQIITTFDYSEHLQKLFRAVFWPVAIQPVEPF